jgi:hypothetical protein
MKQVIWTALLCLLPATITAQSRVIPVTVVVDFGGAQDDPAVELLRVTGAVRTDDGRFVVANGKPLEVRVYDARGRLQRRLGREGRGPGEFEYGAYVRHWPGDSVLTYSASTQRLMLFGLDGTLVREWRPSASEPAPDGVTIYGGAFALNGIGAATHCHIALIRRLAPAQDALQEMMIDPAGRLWLRTADAERWRVHAEDGRLLGAVALPGFEPTHWSEAGLVGHRADQDDFPHIMMIRPNLPAAVRRGPGCPPAPVQSGRAGEVRATIRNAMTAAEVYYSDFGRYPHNLEEVGRRLVLPDGIRGRFEPAPVNSFAFSAWEVATGFRCLVSVGGAIRGYREGTIACGG